MIPVNIDRDFKIKRMKRISEDDIISRIQQGKANKEIADELGKSTQRIKDYIHKLLRKYHCKNRTELAMKFKEVV